MTDADAPCLICAVAVGAEQPVPDHKPCAQACPFPLVGRTIRRVYVGAGEDALYFATDRGVVAFTTDAECCSVTWFADITGFDALIGAPVVCARDIDLPEPPDLDARSRRDCDRLYGFEVVTPKGRAVVAYRNSSNGYYGGSMNYGEVIDALPDGVREVTDDWSA